MDILTTPWPWYIAGPLLGLTVPLLLLIGNKSLGVSSSLRHICAACIPGRLKIFQYDWKAEVWNLFFVAGITLGGFIAGYLFANPEPVRISTDTVANLQAMGIKDFTGLVPAELFSFSSLATWPGIILIVVGGFFIGFGTRYAGGCTSGHTIFGLSTLQFPSLVATICFFAGGLLVSWFILPLILSL